MDNLFDELSKALAGGVSRRDALWRLGGGVAAAIMAPFAARDARADGPDSAPARLQLDAAGRSG